jgi:hypothetical protein
MPYNNFTLRQVEKDFHLQIEEKIDLFLGTEFSISPEQGLSGYCDYSGFQIKKGFICGVKW